MARVCTVRTEIFKAFSGNWKDPFRISNDTRYEGNFVKICLFDVSTGEFEVRVSCRHFEEMAKSVTVEADAISLFCECAIQRWITQQYLEDLGFSKHGDWW